MDDSRDELGVHQARTQAAVGAKTPPSGSKNPSPGLKTVADFSADAAESLPGESPSSDDDFASVPAESSPHWEGPKQLGHFRLVKPIGQGGMGHVFLARDTRLDRDVALKTLRPEVAATHPEVITRFLHEARSAAKLTHPNIVQVYFAGVDRQTPYFAMELVSGKSLKEMIHDEPMSGDVALGYMLQAARGLKAASEKNIVHRDIKPANLMVDENDVVKIADFGLAKNFEAELGLTRTGVMVGTPYYMSPEQSEGAGALGFKSDIYSLGATLYHLVVGHPPFLADTPVRLMVKHATEPVPKHEALDSKLYRLVAKMMAKKPEKRHGSYDELIAEMEEILELSCENNPECAEAMATPRMRIWLKRARMAALVIAIACVALGVGIGSLLTRGDRPKGLLASSAVDAASLDGANASEVTMAAPARPVVRGEAPAIFTAKPEYERIASRLPKELTEKPEFARPFYEKLIHFEFVETLRIAEETDEECPLTSGAAPAATMPVIEAIMREQILRARAMVSIGEKVEVTLDGVAYNLRAISSRSASFARAGAPKPEQFEIAWRDLNPFAAAQIFQRSANPASERDRLFLMFWVLCFDTPMSKAEERAYYESYSDGMELFRDLVKAHWEELDSIPGASASAKHDAVEAAAAASPTPALDYNGVPAAFTAKPDTLSIMGLLPKGLSEDPVLGPRFLNALRRHDSLEIQRIMQETNYVYAGPDRIPAMAQPVLDQAMRDALGRLHARVATGNGPRLSLDGVDYLLMAVDQPGPILGFARATSPDVPAFRVAWADISPALSTALLRAGIDPASERDRVFIAYWARLFDQELLPEEASVFPAPEDTIEARRDALRAMLAAHIKEMEAEAAARPPEAFLAKPTNLTILDLLPPDAAGYAEFRGGLLAALNRYDFMAILKLAEETNYTFMDEQRVVASAMPVLDSIFREYLDTLRRAAAERTGADAIVVELAGARYALRGVGESEALLRFETIEPEAGRAFEVAWADLAPAIALGLVLQVADPSLERDRLAVVYFARAFDLPLADEAKWGGQPNDIEERRRHLRRLIQAHWALNDERDQ